jgi:hypothetical protein
MAVSVRPEERRQWRIFVAEVLGSDEEMALAAAIPSTAVRFRR